MIVRESALLPRLSLTRWSLEVSLSYYTCRERPSLIIYIEYRKKRTIARVSSVAKTIEDEAAG